MAPDGQDGAGQKAFQPLVLHLCRRRALFPRRHSHGQLPRHDAHQPSAHLWRHGAALHLRGVPAQLFPEQLRPSGACVHARRFGVSLRYQRFRHSEHLLREGHSVRQLSAHPGRQDVDLPRAHPLGTAWLDHALVYRHDLHRAALDPEDGEPRTVASRRSAGAAARRGYDEPRVRIAFNHPRCRGGDHRELLQWRAARAWHWWHCVRCGCSLSFAKSHS